jgi:hypothetical protein
MEIEIQQHIKEESKRGELKLYLAMFASSSE